MRTSSCNNARFFAHVTTSLMQRGSMYRTRDHLPAICVGSFCFSLLKYLGCHALQTASRHNAQFLPHVTTSLVCGAAGSKGAVELIVALQREEDAAPVACAIARVRPGLLQVQAHTPANRCLPSAVGKRREIALPCAHTRTHTQACTRTCTQKLTHTYLFSL